LYPAFNPKNYLQKKYLNSIYSSSIKYFYKILFCRSLGFSLYMDRDAGRGKVAYMAISKSLQTMHKQEPHWKVVAVVVLFIWFVVTIKRWKLHGIGSHQS